MMKEPTKRSVIEMRRTRIRQQRRLRARVEEPEQEEDGIRNIIRQGRQKIGSRNLG